MRRVSLPSIRCQFDDGELKAEKILPHEKTGDRYPTACFVICKKNN